MISDVLSIKTMFNIFKECDVKLSYGAMQIYQNVLQHYFQDKEELIVNLIEFEIKNIDIPNFAKYQHFFKELEKAELVKCKQQSLLFFDKWTKYTHLFRLNNVNQLQLASCFKEEMYNSNQLFEAVAMKLKINKAEINELLQLFFAEQDAIQKQYSNESECRKHFFYWCLANGNTKEKTTVKSSSKILGRNEDKN